MVFTKSSIQHFVLMRAAGETVLETYNLQNVNEWAYVGECVVMYG